jgi:hypothetical protein
MKKMILILGLAIGLYACSGNSSKQTTPTDQPATEAATAEKAPAYDPERGTGKFTNVTVSPALDKALADAGNKVYEMKCASCHKLSDEKRVGPVGRVLPADTNLNGS